MKISIDNNRIYLPGGLTYEQRVKFIQPILDKYQNLFLLYWDSPKILKILDILGAYLSRAKDFKNSEYPTLGANKEGRMYKGDKLQILFSDAYQELKQQLGLDDAYEETEE